MFQLSKEQKICNIGGVRLGGQPGQLPSVVVSSIFQKGDQVFAGTGMKLGGYAQYVCLPESAMMAIKPTSMTYEEAVPVPVWANHALFYLRAANIKPGQKVLIIGSTGSIGTYAVQIARYYGAKVTAVGEPGSQELMRSLGVHTA